MNGIEPLLVALIVFAVRDGILAWWLIHRLLSTVAPVLARPAITTSGPEPHPGPVAVEPKPPAAAGRPKPRFTNITATSFAGSNDSVTSRTSAYDESIIDGDRELAAALPYRVPADQRLIRVFYKGRTIDTPIRDVGPWNTKDPYPETGTRPQAETGIDTTGRKTNLAGLDITPAAWTALGYAGNPRDAKDTVDWDFVHVLDGRGAPPQLSAVGGGTEPAWLTLARAEIGFHEQPDNRGITKYVNLAGYGAEGQAWCSIFAGAMLRKAGEDITGANAMAQSWTTAPCVSKINLPRPGAIAVFWRGTRDSGQGHVGFYVGEDATHVQTLGGNEDDQVEIKALAKSASTFGLLGYWWPKEPPPKVT